jgi:hypothetical protein
MDLKVEGRLFGNRKTSRGRGKRGKRGIWKGEYDHSTSYTCMEME